MNINNNNSMKTKTSEIWSLFRPVDSTFALCSICKAKLSYKTTTSNLSKHLHRMHPTYSLSNCNTRYTYLSQKNYSPRYRHRNTAQEEFIIEYVKKHPLLLRSPTPKNRNIFDSLWEQLTAELNCRGPEKDVITWKRTLKHWRVAIRRKLEKIHKNAFRTCKVELTSFEEILASLWRLNEDVSHIITDASSDDDDESMGTSAAANAYDADYEVVEDHEDLTETTACELLKQELSLETDADPLLVQSRKGSAPKNAAIVSNVDNALEMIDQKISSVEEITNKTHLALSEFSVLYKQKLLEDKRHHLAMEQLLAERNEIKRKFLEIEQRKTPLE